MIFLTNLDLCKNQLLNPVIQNLASNPSGAHAGQIYYNSADKSLKLFNGTSWIDVGTTYTLPVASASTLGGVKIGSGLAIDGNGTLSATQGGTADSVEWSGVLHRPTAVSAFTNDAGYLTEHQDITGKADKTELTTHNTATDAHSDIRLLVTGLTTRLNALADSDDTTLDQLSEVVAYIQANRELIESVTTNKVNVSDIINNLTTNVSNKPLSAAQGVALKGLIDALDIPTQVSDLTNDSGFLTTADLATVATTGNYEDLEDKPNATGYAYGTIAVGQTTTNISLGIYNVPITMIAKDRVTKEVVMVDYVLGDRTLSSNALTANIAAPYTNNIDITVYYVHSEPKS